MRLSTHHPLSIPRGSKIIAPSSFGTIMLGGATVDSVRYLWPGDPERGEEHCVELVLDGEPVRVPSWLDITVDQDTPERNERLLFAHSVLAIAEMMDADDGPA